MHASKSKPARLRLEVSRATLRTAPGRMASVQRTAYPYLLLAPVILLVALGILYPLGYMIYLSGQSYSIWAPADTHFVGLDNYVKLVRDPEFWHTFKVSGIWVFGSLIPQFLVGLGIALLLNERFHGRGLVRVLAMAPWVVSGVVVGVIWVWMFDGTLGVINDMLMKVGLITRPIAWTVRPPTAFFVILLANTWRGAPFFATNLLAALQGIRPELYEAAKMDGAGAWQRFRYVTLPMILGTVVLSTLLSTIWTFNYIDLIWTITRGGPINATRTLAIHTFNTAYRDGDFGYAATLSVVMCLILGMFSVLYSRLNRLVSDNT
jgi:multiple sugar transport system permease protein